MYIFQCTCVTRNRCWHNKRDCGTNYVCSSISSAWSERYKCLSMEQAERLTRTVWQFHLQLDENCIVRPTLNVTAFLARYFCPSGKQNFVNCQIQNATIKTEVSREILAARPCSRAIIIIIDDLLIQVNRMIFSLFDDQRINCLFKFPRVPRNCTAMIARSSPPGETVSQKFTLCKIFHG